MKSVEMGNLEWRQISFPSPSLVLLFQMMSVADERTASLGPDVAGRDRHLMAGPKMNQNLLFTLAIQQMFMSLSRGSCSSGYLGPACD